MTNQPQHAKNQKSFSLMGRNLSLKELDELEPVPTNSWKEYAYERLKILYVISKVLSSDDDVSSLFPKILNLCSKTLPLATSVLIESRSQTVGTCSWQAPGESEERLAIAYANAQNAFSYLTGSRNQPPSSPSPQARGVYVTVPLVVDLLRAFGILQLEGSATLNEGDLEFIGAVSDLIAVAVDRSYKSKLERERLELEKKINVEKLEHAEAHVVKLEIERELRDRFLALIRHDLRTPLASARITAELIQHQHSGAPAFEGLAARIVKSVARVDEMIGNLLDANLIRSGALLPLQVSEINLVALVQEALVDLSLLHRDRFVFSSSGPDVGHWDPKCLRRLIENLCNNAIKYGDPDSKVHVRVEGDAEQVIIKVQNQGSLISIEDQTTMFHHFRRGSQQKAGQKEGWGIGLTLVRGVAEAHGGSIRLTSDTEHGTVFTVSLPRDCRDQIKA